VTVPELISRVLDMLQGQFYCDLPRSAWFRDEKYLVAAIGTYGHECRQRGWEFSAEFICGELTRLIRSFMKSGAEPRWMPIYLQNAIRQHIRERADELNAQGKARRAPAAILQAIVGELKRVEAVREPSAIDLMASVYRDVRQLRREGAAARRGKTGSEKRQGTLL
jgi:hypothetical protein